MFRFRYRLFGLGGMSGRGFRIFSAYGFFGRGGEFVWSEELVVRTSVLGRSAEVFRWRVTDVSRLSESINIRRRACVRVEIF